MESIEQEFKELTNKREQEALQQTTKKIYRLKVWYLILELVLSIIGYGLIIYHSSFLLALGVWFAIWGNNMGFIRGYSNKNNLLKKLWR